MATPLKIHKLKQKEAEQLYVDRLGLYLRRIGWTRSAIARRAMDSKGNTYPWFTYAAIRFLMPRLKPTFEVFEYGSGHSTTWWAERVAHVVACEHNRKWFDLIKPTLPSNVDYVFRELEYGGDYAKEITRHRNRAFDIVVVDGRDRVNCMKSSLTCLSRQGVLIVDNSDRERYSDGFDALRSAGYRRLDFFGLGPVNTSGWCTSVFYKDRNCLEI